MIDIDLQVKTSIPDDFYLQWDHIYSWQCKLNLSLCVEQIINKVID